MQLALAGEDAYFDDDDDDDDENGGTSYVQNELGSHSFSLLKLANNMKGLKMLPDLLILSFLSNLNHPHPNLKLKHNLQPKLMLNPTFKLLTLVTIMLIHLGWRRIHPRHLLLPSQSREGRFKDLPCRITTPINVLLMRILAIALINMPPSTPIPKTAKTPPRLLRMTNAHIP